MLSSLLVACALMGQAPIANSANQGGAGNPATVTEEAVARQVRNLLRLLSSDLAAERQEAEQGLINLGPAALSHLPARDASMPAELRLRLQRVEEKLQQQAAEAAGRASTVTLQGKMPLSKAIAAIEQQTGNRLIDYRGNFQQQQPDTEVDVAFNKTPFWQAVDQLLDQAKLTVYSFADEDGVAFVNRDNTEAARSSRPTSYVGPFRVEALEFQAQRSLRFPQNNRLQLSLELVWEPRVAPIALSLPLLDLEATGDDGKSLEIAGLGDRSAEIATGMPSTELHIPWEAPDRAIKSIAKLQGVFRALVPGRLEAFRFTDLKVGKREAQRRASATVTLDNVRKNNDAWEMRVILAFDEAAGALESFRGWVFNNPCYIETANGQKVAPLLTETVRQTENEVGIAYYFDLEQDLAGATLVYQTPTVILPLEFKFEMKDLPLP